MSRDAAATAGGARRLVEVAPSGTPHYSGATMASGQGRFMHRAARVLSLGAVLCLPFGAGHAQPAGDSGRSLAPGTFDKTDTTNDPRGRPAPTPYRPPASVHMGNQPVGQDKESDFGLSAETRRKLDAALGDPARIEAVLGGLSGREKTAAADYLKKKRRPIGQTEGLPAGKRHPKSAAGEADQHERDCADMRQVLAPRAPDEAWIVDQMARSYCRPDGNPMSEQEEIAYKLKRLERRDNAAAANSGAFDCSYKRAGDGAAWDATCANSGWPEGAQCNPGEACPDYAVRWPNPRPAPANGGNPLATPNPGNNATAPSRLPPTGGNAGPQGSGVAHGRNPVAPPVAPRHGKSDVTGLGGVDLDIVPLRQGKDLSDFKKKALSLPRSSN